jgi:hypothetical protein
LLSLVSFAFFFLFFVFPYYNLYFSLTIFFFVFYISTPPPPPFYSCLYFLSFSLSVVLALFLFSPSISLLLSYYF